MIWLAIFVWAVAALAIWNALAWPRLRATSEHARDERISVLIPARNEEAHLGPLLNDLRRCPTGIAEILIYDDHSTDGTAAAIAAGAARDSRVRRLSPDPLPDGWRGKPFACARLAAAARGDWLVFLDADVRVAPDAPARVVAEAKAQGATFLSAWPGIEMRGFSERWLMPLLNYVVFTLFPAPLSFLFDRKPSLGLAHGACIACRAEDYRSMGGHERVKTELFEDTRLAQAWRASGRRGFCVDGQKNVRTRMYDSFGAIWRGFSKNLGPAFRRRWSFALFLTFHFVLGLLPFLALIAAAAGAVAGMGPAVAALGVLAIRGAQALRFRYPPGSALLHPFAVAAMLALAAVSRVRYETGGVEWKGRRYGRLSADGGGRP